SNPLISTFTFFALLLTIIQNQKIIGINEAELRETRKEIELTREANEAQAIEFKVQNEITKNQAEIQTTTEAVLKASDLVNNIWKGPTSVPIHRTEADGSVRTQYLTLKECSAPWFDLDLDESFFKSVESTISEIIKLLVLHKKLLLRLEAISPNNSMVITVSLLVKAPIEWLEEHKAFDRHLYEESTLELLNFYKDNWNNKQTIEVR
ncbi:MAG: hypothetical protein QNK43_10590, partial [Amphritea sp.]|nr:hypothetical protein [Amphritea sp.]